MTCEMCPEISDELAPELPFEAEHTVEIMGEEVEVCDGCKRELEKGMLPCKERIDGSGEGDQR